MTDIFVFGSNERGRHGAGSALAAAKKHGAIEGQGVGIQGLSYGIPTKDKSIETLPLRKIGDYVFKFVKYAHEHPEDTFHVVEIGCGLAGYTPEDIAPMFLNRSDNVKLPMSFIDALETFDRESWI